MVNRHSKFQVFMFIHYEDMKSHAKCGIWGGLGGVKGHRGSLAMLPFDRGHTSSYSILIEITRLSCTVFEL